MTFDKLQKFDDLNKYKGFKLVSYNIRSLINKLPQLEVLLHETKLDALCINESWLSSDVENDRIRISDYKIYRLDRKVKKRGGGLCAYIAGRHKVDAYKYEEYSVSGAHLEALVLEVKQKCTKPIILIVAYRPPQGNLDEGLSELKNVLQGVGKEQDVCLMGDFNVDFDSHRLPATKKLKALCKEHSLIQQIKSPT